MRKFRVAKRVLMLVLCGMLAVPAAGMLARPMVVEAAQDDSVPEAKKVARNKKASNLKSYYDKYANLMSSEDKTALDTSVNAVITQITKPKADNSDYEVSNADADELIAIMKSRIDNAAGVTKSDANEEPSEPEPAPDPTPKTTNDNIMIGGNWVTPVANAGRHVNVVLPVVNMGRTRVKNAVVTPQISDDSSKWPFEIETSNYTQTIDILPGTDDGGTDMERRRELTWTLKTRKDAPSGYMPIAFDVTFEKEDRTLETVTLTSYVNVVGTTGVSADGTASTPRVIVTGFSTSPEVVHAGETFTLTLHMQNTSKATAVQNMLFDIQAASESTDTTYVAAAFLPTAGSSTIFVDRIPAGSTKDISMEMEARSDLSQKPYVVNVKMNYEDENVNAYENTASVSIPVRQEARVDISSIDVMPDSIEVGSEVNVMFSIYNIGKTKLYNTSVKFVADSVSGGDTYLGNIDPGATANLDAYLTGAAATMDDGIVKIQITYEDEAGEAATIEKEMTLFVNEMYIPDDMGMEGDMFGEDMMQEKGGFKIWYVLVPLALVIIGAAVFFVIRRKKKKKAAELLEAIDDDEFADVEEVDLSDGDEEEKEE